MRKEWFTQIDEALKSYEDYKPYHQYSIEWITDRIAWCYKWKKITKEQMETLANRVVIFLEGQVQ